MLLSPGSTTLPALMMCSLMGFTLIIVRLLCRLPSRMQPMTPTVLPTLNYTTLMLSLCLLMARLTYLVRKLISRSHLNHRGCMSLLMTIGHVAHAYVPTTSAHNSPTPTTIRVNSALGGTGIATTRPSLTATACGVGSRRMRDVRRSESNLRRLRSGNQRYRLTSPAPPLLLYPLGTLYPLHPTLLLPVTTLSFPPPLFTRPVMTLLSSPPPLFTRAAIMTLSFQPLRRTVWTS